MALLALVRLFQRYRKPAVASERLIADRRDPATASAASSPSVQRDRDAGGWTPELAGRALGALRIAATYAVGRPVSQMPASRLLADGGETAEPGRLILKAGWPRGKRIAVSGAVTPQTIARVLARPGNTRPRARRCSSRCRRRSRAFTAATFSRDGHARRRRARRGARHGEAGAAPHEVRAALVHEAARGPPRGHGAGQPRVVPITQVPAVIRDVIFEWRNARTADLLFTHRDDSIIAMVVLIGLAMAVLVGRALTRNKAGRTQVALPAVLDWSGGSWTSIVRHGALLLFLAGLPFFVLALADPYSSLTHEQVSFPGRRIALMIDASSSMMARFPAAHLNAKAPNEATFFTTVAAAETFIRQRMSGKYHDLIGLIEFGDEAYVVTPFTTDYDNILLSLSLIGDWTEFMKFPDQGTTIGLAIEQGDRAVQGVRLPRRGRQPDADLQRRPGHAGDDPRQDRATRSSPARVQTKIPVYMIRTSYNKGLGAVLPDDIWKPAIEATGGKFYPAGDEPTMLNAIKDIDTRSAGRVDVKRYSSQQPKFARLRVHGGELLDGRAHAAVDRAVFPEVSVGADQADTGRSAGSRSCA